MSKIIVQKYGGATLADPQKIKAVAARIQQLHKSGVKLVVIVSAMGQTTNQLIKLAGEVSARPALRELDMLLSVGERISMSLLSMALNDLGCAAISFTGSQAGILTDDSHVNANIIDVKAFRVVEALRENKVVILAGFQGVSANTKEITTLGRGGSDITAVAMADFLKSERCEILKDVDCVYSADPKLVSEAEPIAKMNYRQLADMTTWGAKVLHQRSVQLAAEKNVSLFVGSAANEKMTGTLISHDQQFSEQKILSINSYAEVFCGEWQHANEDFQVFLQTKQISRVQFLDFKNKKNYFTAPSETLQLVSDFEKLQNFYQLTDKALCSVSATFSQGCADSDLTKLQKVLSEKNVAVLDSRYENNTLHFILKSEQRIQAIKILHAQR